MMIIPRLNDKKKKEKEEDCFERLAASMRIFARQSPHLLSSSSDGPQRLGLQLMFETAANSAAEAGDALRRWGCDANETASLLLQRLPTPLRRLVLATIHRKRAGAVCVFDAYERMLALRQDMRAPQHREFYLRLNETLCFMDAQEDLRACIQAHRIACQAQVMSHDRVLLDCGACGFTLRPSASPIY